MRLPRQATPLSLSAEPPRAGLAADDALLERAAADGRTHVRWWRSVSAAVVVGLGLRHRVAQIVDALRAEAAGVQVLDRRAGGGALLLDAGMLCGAVAVPLQSAPASDDVTESYRWLGDWLVGRLAVAGVRARRVEVAEARADVAALRARADANDSVARLLLASCYGALSPHEVVDSGGRKLVGLAQVRRRNAALFQIGILVRDQAPLADVLRAPDDATRERLRVELARRTVGLEALSGRSAVAAVAASVGATPFAA